MPKPKQHSWIKHKDKSPVIDKRKRLFQKFPVHEFHLLNRHELLQVRKRRFVGRDSRAITPEFTLHILGQYREFMHRIDREVYEGLWRALRRGKEEDIYIEQLKEMPSMLVITAKKINAKVPDRARLPKSAIFFPGYVQQARGKEARRRMRDAGLIVRTITLPRKVYAGIVTEAMRIEQEKQKGFIRSDIAQGITNYFIHRYWQAVESIMKEMEGKKSV